MNHFLKQRKEMQFIIFVIPAAVIYLVFFLMPIASSLYYSLFDFGLLKEEMHFVGIKNYIELITNTPEFYTALKNNILFTLFVLVFQTIISFLLAVLLNGKMKGTNFFKTFFFLPVVLSSVAITFIWIFMYDSNYGCMNLILKSIGLGFLERNWLGDPNISLFSVAVTQVWQFVGFEMIIFYAGLKNIPEELYEAASIEGAGFFKKMFRITIPMMAPATTVAVVLTTLGCFKVFDLIYIMTSGGPYQSTEVLAKIIYDYAFKYNRMGFASVISVVLLTITLIIGFTQLIYLRTKEDNLQ